MTDIFLNDMLIQAFVYEELPEKEELGISFSFHVKSGEEYHRITTLLYQNQFAVHVPARGLSFTGTIRQYYTSFTNLYEENQVGEFHLALTEVQG
ncbi:DUF3219 family protein [Ectobacillus ponti]|uniref:YkvR family protein n=1 Tax=Ectobacillus ponti TaxID=2961894 RepID=A0AA41X7K7_9BACI|nr:DUF3219 family protein [Ectobacillus ponti]MCP8970379.1 YkvR family protein [Ectobacillus ponti]